MYTISFGIKESSARTVGFRVVTAVASVAITMNLAVCIADLHHKLAAP
jgi:hypothetical protein